MLDRVDPPIHHLDNLIERHERRLQACQLHQRLHRPPICLPTLLDLLPALAQARQAKVVLGVVGGEALELGEEHSADVFLLGAQAESRGFGRLLDLVGYGGAADGVCDFSERESGNLHDAAHLPFGFIDAAGYFWGRGAG